MASTVELVLKANTKQAEKAVQDFASTSTRAVKGVESAFDSLKIIAGAAVAVFAGGKVLDLLEGVAHAASEQEDAINSLNVALKLSGEFSRDASLGFQEFATQIENSTKFSDDAVLSAIALAKSFNTTNEEAKKLVTAATDLATVNKTDLNSAVQLLGKSLDGTAGRLNETVPAVRNLTAAQLSAGAAIQVVGDRLKGAASGAANTFEGQITKLKNSFNNLEETLGDFIIKNPIFIKAIQFASKEFKSLEETIRANSKQILEFVKGGILFAIDAFIIFADVAGFVNGIVKEVAEAFLNLANALVALPARFKIIFDGLKNLDFDTTVKSLEDLDKEIQKDSKAKIFDVLGKGLSSSSKAAEGLRSSLEKVDATALKTTKDGSEGLQNNIELTKRLTQEEQNRIKQLEELKTKNPILRLVFQGLTDVNIKISASEIGASIAKGAKGASEIISKTLAGVVAIAAGLPEIAGPLGDIIELFAQGPDKVRETLTQFFEAIPQIVENIINSIPVVIEVLAEQMPRVAIALANKMPFVAVRMAIELVRNIPSIVASFAREFLKIPGQFLAELKKGIPGLSALQKGGAGGAAIGNFFGGVVGGIAGGFGLFAEGGLVPSGFPNDSFPARLTSNELVIPRGDTDALRDFLKRERTGQAFDVNELVKRVEGSSEKNLTVNLAIGEKELASVLLKVNRSGFRTA